MANSNYVKLTEAEKQILQRYVEYGDKNKCLEDITTKGILSALKIDSEIAKKLKDSYEYKIIKEAKDRFTRKAIQNGFASFLKFYDWYVNQLKIQQDSCYYCKSSRELLNKVFRSKGEPQAQQEKKPLYSTKPAFSSSFQVDKKHPNKGYSKENCVLACAFCNNAKSDMVKDAELFKKSFGSHIGSFLRLFDK